MKKESRTTKHGKPMPEPAARADAIAEGEVARAVVRLSRALEQTSELLEAVTDLHRKVVELHAVLTEPLVDLEDLLTEAEKQEIPSKLMTEPDDSA